MDNNISWELYRSYLSVLQEGSLSGAARALGVAQPTVGRHIDTLEQQLGVSLFTRSQQGLLATEAAQALKPFAQSMQANAAALLRAAEAQGSGVRGTVRISASEVVGAEVLPPVIAGLQGQYPELNVELVLTNRVQDLLHREADIAVRMVAPEQGSLIARRIGDIELGLHAHRRYLDARGTPQTLEQLTEHALIGFDQETPFLRSARHWLPQWRREHFTLRTDSDLAQLAMIRAGVGIGVCQVRVAQRDPALVRVLAHPFKPRLTSWLTMHEDLRNSPRCKVTFEALLSGLEQYVG
ncbi:MULTISPECIES: LysR family transcriptional regulator [Pseudomonas]|uniref:LysR family transcriptional regulator n=1 Tax=Pseudomonas monsensis TaxID=2745509 RepID=A0ABT3YMU6_9PSED|nr:MULTISPECIES: LysR family transcriptional regulator [Pseudomonas]PTT60763.1 LysR family transcriptional regulator [Pseudomonas sp. HMWF007]PTT87282.1 LysR family transcriptional regulator [Pseudomonas sp. HMWF005]RON61775.1 LysR family transcriptional regulator [Pseudomonas fluorescens]MCY0106804.1 LysR family transcriptional regulator [Pseudomonas monsensis]MDZ3826530.1 LysR family transcriptional regulator [Pseudomonas monsensis]